MRLRRGVQQADVLELETHIPRGPEALLTLPCFLPSGEETLDNDHIALGDVCGCQPRHVPLVDKPGCSVVDCVEGNDLMSWLEVTEDVELLCVTYLSGGHSSLPHGLEAARV